MKGTLFIVYSLLVIPYLSFAQSNLCGQVDYQTTYNISRLIQRSHSLSFNDSRSLYLETNVEKSPLQEIERAEENGMLTQKVAMGRSNTTPTFCLNNHSDFYFSKILEDEEIIVRENELLWNWTLHNESKDIGGFSCQKATIRFRGRNYTAWFTNSIPVRYGPWKFQGLPGLILEVYDEDYLLHIVANKISIGNEVNCSIAFDYAKLRDALSISEYLEKKKEIAEEFFSRLSSKLPKGSKPLVKAENCADCNSGSIEIFDEGN